MQIADTSFSSGLSMAVRLAAFALCASSAGLMIQAEQTVPLNVMATLKTPANLYYSSHDENSFSSSSLATTDAVDAERFNLGGEGMQPPPRRRYGRPRYTDKSHNADGSNKYMFELGGGLTLPTGGTHNYLKTNFNFQGGVGRNFNQKLALVAQFDYARFGVQTNTLNNLLAVYDSLGAIDGNGNPLTQLGGSSHVWSFTVNPVYNFAGGEKSGAYVVGGVGFYHKTADFTVPVIGTAYDPYYGTYQYQANETLDKYTSNAAGFNGGFGYTYKPSRFANERFFAEARYVYVSNSPRPYSLGSSTNSYFNVFPQNSAKTTFIPVTFGVRF